MPPITKGMSHVTHINEPCHTYEWVMSHIWMSHVTHMNEPCHTYEWVMSHMRMSHVTYMNESCHTYEWVMSHICMSRATYQVSLQTKRLMRGSWTWCPSNCKRFSSSFMSHPWLIHSFSFVTHLSVLRDSNCKRFSTSFMMTYSWLIHDSFVTHPWLIHKSFMNHTWLIHDSSLLDSWVIQETLGEFWRVMSHEAWTGS